MKSLLILIITVFAAPVWAQPVQTGSEQYRQAMTRARLVVDPMNRWQQYGPLAQSGIEKAKSLNTSNPIPYVQEGTSLMYTPEQFGGGPANAKLC